MCQGTFQYVYIGVKELKKLLHHLEHNGLVPRVHGNKGHCAPNTTPFEVAEAAISFLKNFAEHFGIPHPAPLHGRDGRPTCISSSI